MGSESKNVIMAVVLSIIVLFGWNYISPQTPQNTAPQQTTSGVNQEISPVDVAIPTAQKSVSVASALQTSERIMIDTPKMAGSLSLKGARLDNVVLKDYKETIEENSANIRLLSPRNTEKQYFVDTGWVSATGDMPNGNTIWNADNTLLTDKTPVTLSWTNAQGVIFKKTYAIDKNYMVTLTQTVENTSATNFDVADYGLVARGGVDENKQALMILHEGPIGVFDGTLTEETYDDIKDDKRLTYTSVGGWLGITDQFWLVGLIPSQKSNIESNFRYVDSTGLYQTDFKNSAVVLKKGDKKSYTMQIFVGAKEVNVIDTYAEKYNIPMFDRAVDFGWFYFLTKPFFLILHFISGLIGNVGVAMLVFVLLVKAILFPLANKSYRSMAKMKVLAPRITEMKKRFGDDRQGLSVAMMKLYKEEKVNPASGCLPMLIQIPIFFSLYKVLYVTLELRHAPFFGWIHDLSAPDPLGLLTLFGLISWNVPDILQIVNIGIWPILMGVSMWLQFRLNPTPQDPIQAKVFAFMPIAFTFFLGSFPAGLVIYWTWNNMLSITQQYTIQKRITG